MTHLHQVGKQTSTQPSCETKVDEFDLAACLVDAHDVLWFEVQVHNALFVDELNTIDNLQHILNDFTFGQLKIFINNSLKQLTARDPATNRDKTDVTNQ